MKVDSKNRLFRSSYNGSPCVIKFLKSSSTDRAWTYEYHSNIAAQHVVNVPTILYSNKDEGVVVYEDLEQYGPGGSLSHNAYGWRELGRIIAQLHTLNPSELHSSQRLKTNWNIDYKRRLESQLAHAKSNHILLPLSLEIEKVLSEHEHTVLPVDKSALIHNDAQPSNVWSNGQKSWLIDFEHSHEADVRLELVQIEFQSQEFWPCFCEGYGEIPLLPEPIKKKYLIKCFLNLLSYWNHLILGNKSIYPRLDQQYLEWRERFAIAFNKPVPKNRLRMKAQSNDYSKYEPFTNSSPIKTSIVIPVFNRLDEHVDLLRETLLTLSANKELVKYKEWIDVVIVDDGSDHPVAECVDITSFPCPVKIIRQRNNGRAFARNIGAQCSSGELIIFLDSDTLVSHPNFISSHWCVHNACPKCITVGLAEEVGLDSFFANVEIFRNGCPRLINDYRFHYDVSHKLKGGTKVYKLLDDTRWFKDFGFSKKISLWSLPYMVATFDCGVSRAIFDQVGRFDSSFSGWGAEDNHFAAKAIVAGAYIIPIKDPLTFHIKHHFRDSDNSEIKQGMLSQNQLHMEILLDTKDVC